MVTALEICDALGRKPMAEALGVGVTTISNAAVAGVFPAKWYRVVRAMCREVGCECPDDVFNFAPIRLPKSKQSPNAPMGGSGQRDHSSQHLDRSTGNEVSHG